MSGVQWNTRLGVILFGIYSMFYSGFVVLNAFWPQAMEGTPWAGVNWAILYGFALIVAAFALAAIYGLLCHDPAPGSESDPHR